LNIRIGQGYDSHALVSGRTLYLGGAKLESPIGCLGHSDGDCLLHALIDAILGALGKGDIGQWFPDNDPKYKDIRSTELLKEVLHSQELPNFEISNIDMTLFLNQPKMKPHRKAILDSLSELLNLPIERLNLKAKTWEGLGIDQVVSASVSLILNLKP
jgi:2-C-methyl-D-erythritol 2,4-cyclodiphosphate synthase